METFSLSRSRSSSKRLGWLRSSTRAPGSALQWIFAQLCQLFTPAAVMEASNQLRTPKLLMSQSEALRAIQSARRASVTCSTDDHPGFRGVKTEKGLLMLRGSWFIAILNGAYGLCTSLAQPSLLGICFAAAWQAIALITTATKRSLRVFVQSGFTRIHFRFSTAKSTRQSMPCRS